MVGEVAANAEVGILAHMDGLSSGATVCFVEWGSIARIDFVGGV